MELHTNKYRESCQYVAPANERASPARSIHHHNNKLLLQRRAQGDSTNEKVSFMK